MSLPNTNMMQTNNFTQQYSSVQPASQHVVEVISSSMQNFQTSSTPSLTNNTLINNTTTLAAPTKTTTAGMLLVPTVRSMIDVEYTQRLIMQQQQQQQENQDGLLGGNGVPKLELAGLSAGAIADLVNITRELKARNVDGGDFAGGEGGAVGSNNCGKQRGEGEEEEVDQYYVPLQPFSLPMSAIPPRIEPGRVDIRLHALHSKLGKI